MKRTVSIVMSLLLAVTMVVALAGCGSDKEKIVGKWETSLDMGTMINESIKSDPDAAEMAGDMTFNPVDVKVIFEFKDDGTYTFACDEESSKSAFESIKNDFKSNMEKYISDMLADDESGMSVDEAMDMMGINMDELIDQMDVESMVGELEQTGKYKLEDGKLYMTTGDGNFDENSYDTYEFVSNSELKLLDTVGEDSEFAKSMYPITLKKA